MSEFDILAVTGNPILHSKSPNMFNCAFEQMQMPATYIRLAADSAKEAIALFNALELKGMNVTAPFKEDIMVELDEIDSVAEFIGGVNTIIKKDEGLKGYNTDYFGVRDSIISSIGNNLENKKCLIIGAGGAGKAAAFALKFYTTVDITIANRTVEKARLAAEGLGRDCHYAGLDKLSELLPKTDIIILALTQGVNPIKAEWLSKKHIVFDANYKDSELIKMAKAKGCTIIDASDWLVFQGTRAYGYFFGGTGFDYEILKQGLTTYNLHEKTDKIALVGFMGSGKTTIGKKLAKKMGYTFVDTDEMIVERERKTVSEIFEQNGEAYFRTCEQQVLQSLFNSNEKLIISCGGGMAINDDNRALLKKHCLVVWLYATPESTVKRINLETRPLLNIENPIEKAQTLLAERKEYYAQACDMVISTEKFDVERITNKITDEIERITLKQ